MSRSRRYTPLRVLVNNRPVGYLRKEPGGNIDFRYLESWVNWESAFPISLSLPLREDAYRGAVVVAVFENLLPDSDRIRQRIAAKVSADGIDAYSLLAQIGHDCAGAMQFIPDDDSTEYDTSKIEGYVIADQEIEALLTNLALHPLGMDQDRDFRISVAGAQEKTALLFHEGRWWKPHGGTPTTHILKMPMGALPNGLDLSKSIENEYYCLKLAGAFGMPVNDAVIKTFGKTKALVLQRFDRTWTSDGRLLRIPQEDFCQSLSFPPNQKYQNEGGPGMVEILRCLQAADRPAEDQKKFLKAQILYWLIGATDGHAKNFSIFLGRGGRFQLTPLYDILTVQPSLDAGQLRRQDMKLAMFAGTNRHYAIEHIRGRHFIQTAERAGIAASLATEALEEISRDADKALEAVGRELPEQFPYEIHESVKKGLRARLANI